MSSDQGAAESRGDETRQQRERVDGADMRRHPLNRGCGIQPTHLQYWHLQHETIFPVASQSPGLATGASFQFRAIAGDWRTPE